MPPVRRPPSQRPESFGNKGPSGFSDAARDGSGPNETAQDESAVDSTARQVGISPHTGYQTSSFSPSDSQGNVAFSDAHFTREEGYQARLLGYQAEPPASVSRTNSGQTLDSQASRAQFRSAANFSSCRYACMHCDYCAKYCYHGFLATWVRADDERHSAQCPGRQRENELPALLKKLERARSELRRLQVSSAESGKYKIEVAQNLQSGAGLQSRADELKLRDQIQKLEDDIFAEHSKEEDDSGGGESEESEDRPRTIPADNEPPQNSRKALVASGRPEEKLSPSVHLETTDPGSNSAGQVTTSSRDTNRPDSGFNTGLANVDMSAILDPISYEAELDDMEVQIFANCNVMTLIGPLDFEGVATLQATPKNQISSRLRGVISSIGSMQARGYCKETLVVLAQDVSRTDVIRATDITINSIRELLSLSSSRHLDTSRLSPLVWYFCSIFGIETESSTELSVAWQPEAFLGILCSLLRLTVALYARSHCSDLLWEQDGTIERIMYRGPIGSKHTLRCRRLACLDDFIGDPVWVFNAANDHTPASVSISVRQFANMWGPLYVVPSAKENGHIIAIHTEGGLLYRSSSETLSARLAGEEIPCHWTRATPSLSVSRSSHADRASNMLSLKIKERLPKPLEEFPISKILLIGHPVTQTVTSTTVVTKPSTSTEFDRNHQCSLDFKQFGQDNAFKIKPTGTQEAYFTLDEHHIALSAGQYVNVGIQKTWKRRPAITRKDRIISFCTGSLATAARLKEILQLRVGLEVSACTFSGCRITLDEALRIAFPNDTQVIKDACIEGHAAIVAAYLGELRATGLSHDESALFHWPWSVGVSEVYQVNCPPMWLSMLKDTPDSCCFATLSGRCLQFTIRDGENIIGSRCASHSKSSKGSSRPVLRTCIEISPDSSLRPPLRHKTRVRLAAGELRIQQSSEKDHIAFYHQPRLKWPARKSTGSRADADRRHRELQVASRSSQFTFNVWIMDSAAS